MYPFLLYVHLYCFRNRQAEGRQIADPYEAQKFFLLSFNLLLSKPLRFGRLVSAPTRGLPFLPFLGRFLRWCLFYQLTQQGK